MATQNPDGPAGALARIFVLLRRPRSGWERIKLEPRKLSRLLGYAALGGFLAPASRSASILWSGLPLNGVIYRPPIASVLIEAGVSYGLIFCLSLGFGLVVTVWAHPFGGARDWLTGLTVSVYSSVPGWLGGLLFLSPRLVFLTAGAALYGVFIFYRGAQILIEPPHGRRLAYVAAVLASYGVLAITLTGVLRAVIAHL